MLAKDLLNKNIPVVKSSDNGKEVLSLMDLFRVSHLPVVNNGMFGGMVSDTDVYGQKDLQLILENYTCNFDHTSVQMNDHLLDIIKVASLQKLSVIPVVSPQLQFKSSISQADLIEAAASFMGVMGPGGIVVVFIKGNSYSMSEISKIVEDNDTRIISSYVHYHPDQNMVKLTLKLNSEDISTVILSLQRYGYIVETWYVNQGKLDALIEERFESLIRFLEI